MCLAAWFGDGSCNGHRSCSVTAPVPSPIKAQINVVPPGDPQGVGMGTYLTGSCMACSHDQQREKRWNMLSSLAWRDGLSSAPTKRAAQHVSGLRPPARACSPWLGDLTPGCPVPRPSTTASSLVHASQAGGQKPATGQYPRAWTPQADPALAAPSCIAGAPVRLSPARPCRAAPAHIPFAQQLLKSNLDLNYLLLAASLILVGRPRPVAAGTWSAKGLPTVPSGTARHSTAWHCITHLATPMRHWAALCLHHWLEWLVVGTSPDSSCGASS